MKTIFYLAMTPQERSSVSLHPTNYAYMACHFSPYGPGLTDLPDEMTKSAMVILNDRIPYRRHDCRLIARQLASLPCESLLLDLQQTDIQTAKGLIDTILEEVHVPLGVPERYAHNFPCAVFLDPADADTDPLISAGNWPDREIWLDLSPGTVCYRISREGSKRTECTQIPREGPNHQSRELICHYSYSVCDDEAVFNLWRDAQDAAEILRRGQKIGVTRGVGLYQEWGSPKIFL